MTGRTQLIGCFLKMGLACGLAATLAGCISPRSAEGPVHTYVLKVEEGIGDAEPSEWKRDTREILLVSLPQAEPGFDTAQMVYLRRPYEVSYYSVNQWADTPARMLAPLLVRALERSRNWRAVVPMPSSIRGDYRLDVQGLMLQQEFLQQPSRLRLALRMQMIELREQKVIGVRRFEVLEDAHSEDAYGGVLAANRAVAKLLDSVTNWLAACMKGNRKDSC